ncbi:MAG: PDZ domain-containing protein, partial [Promethearchaeia archaeon]
MVVDEAYLTQDEEGYSNYKILPGDRLLAVNGQQCERVDVQEIHALLKGPAGTAVELSLARRQMPAQEESAPLACRSENAVYRVRVMRHAALRQEILSRKKGQHSSSVLSAIPQTVVAETSPIVVKTNMHSTKFPESNQASAKAQEALPPPGASRLETHTMETLMEPLLTMQTAAAGVITAAAVTLEDQVATASSVVSVAADRAA